jgi:hypothetical protein
MNIMRKFLLLAVLVICISNAFSQTAINTTHVASNGNALVTFNVQNTNAFPIIITTVRCNMNTSASNSWQVLYNTTAVNSAGATWNQGVVGAGQNGWVQPVGGSGTIANTVDAIYTLSTTLSITIPPGATYGMCIGATTMRYADLAAGVNNFTAGGVTLKTGDNISWGGTIPPATPGNYPRGLVGGITFEPAGPCTDPPVPGNISSTQNPVCPNASFTLSLSGGTGGTGQTYQWERSTTSSSSGFTDVAGATNSTLITSAATSTWYRVRVTCGATTITSAAYQVNVSAGCFTYCTSVPTSTIDEEIYSFTLNGNKITSPPCGTAAPGPGSIAYRYSNFYPLGSIATLIPGLTVDFIVEENECDGSLFYNNGCGVWIDFNRDGDFNDPGEEVYKETTTTVSPRNILGNINIPLTASSGLTGMRIIVAENFSGATLTPCLAYTYGETEDYLVNIGSPTPCNGAPNAGTASATPTTACLGQNITLSSTGVTVLNGLSYQWQISPDNINWSDIAGANNFSATVTQTASKYYRFRVICSNTNDTSYTASSFVFTPPLLGGNYTIDKTVIGAANLYPNTTVFNSFNAAYSAMLCGITSSVVLNVVNGPYNEQLIMNGNIPGTNASTTVTFNGNGNTLTFATTAAEPAVIKLKNGLSYVRFDNLVIAPTGATNGHGVHLTSDANYNIIRNCTINLNSTAVGTGFAGVVISGSETSATGTGTTTALCDYNEIRNNTINGGYYGITQAATFAGGAHGYNKIIGNTITNFYQYGIYTNSTYYSVIDSNYISRPTRTNTAATVAGIYFTTNTDNATVSRNRISNPFGNQLGATAAFNGIDFSTCSATSGSPNVVTNNLIYKMNGNGAINGISNTGSANAWFAHNTISLDSLNTGTVNTRGFSLGTAAVGIIFYDNLISVTRSGPGTKMAIYLAGLLFACDYNNYYVSGPGGTSAIGFYTANRTTLALWQSNTGHDAHSLDKNPVFVDVNNGYDGYKPGNAQIDNEGLYFGTDYDILGVVRGGSPTAPAGTKPDMGAYEFIAPACSVPPINGTTNITPASPVCQASTIKLDLSILPYGSGQSFQWQSSPTGLPGTWTNVGTPNPSPDTLITATTSLYYRAIVSCVSSIDSSNPVLVTVTPALPAGTYTIDKGNPTNYIPGGGGGTNFISFNDAKTAMQTCGILGSVVFNVLPLTSPGVVYNEQLKLDSIKGTSTTSTVTFNGNGNTIAFNAGTPPTNTERAVIKLSRADYITFDSLRIDATGAFTYGYGIQLINNADTNTFRKCTVLANNSSTSLNYSGIVINSADAAATTLGNTWCDGNTFDRNLVNGGYYGVTLVGSATQKISDNSFTNNRIEDFYSTGFHIAGTYNTLIEGNIITRPNRTVVTTTYGIHVNGAESPRLRISKNRIYHLFASVPTNTSAQYGIYHNTVDVTAGNDNIVSNNLIHSLDGGGIIYALYNTNSDGVKYQHNTVSLDHFPNTFGNTTRGFYQTGSAVGIEFVNNIITVTRGGTGTKYGIYLETAASEVISNRNDIYVNGAAGTNYFGYGAAANRLTLAAWQTNVLKDANSFSVDPVYVDSANGNYAPGIQTIDNAGTFVGIATDILSNVRDPFTPDIGAYEFVPITCTNPPVAGTASVTPSSGICLEAPITLDLTGNSQIGTLTFQWQSSPTGLPGTWVNIGPILYSPQFNTVTGTNTHYRAEVRCGAGAPSYSTETQVTLNAVVLAGTYTISNGLPTATPSPNYNPGDNFNSFADAVTAMSCGITGPVVFNVMPGSTSGVYNEQVKIPYIRNSSAVNTITFQSNSGVPASANLTYSATAAATNYTLRLEGAKYITFQNMTISGTNTTNGRVVELFDTASYNNILNCVISAPVVATTANTVAGVYANAFKGTGNLVKGNIVTGGAMGIYIWGTSALNLTTDNIIDSNTVSGAYAYGIYANFHKRAKLLRNTVNVTAPLTATSYGIYASDCDSSYSINGNKVNINAATTTVYGIYVNNSDSALNNWGNVIGNTITATANTGALYGLYLTNSPGHKVLNNVININTSAAVSYGLYNNNTSSGNYYNNTVNSTSTNAAATNVVARFENTSATNIFIRNNIFSHSNGGRALYIANPAQPFGSDYNMLYTTGAVLVQRGSPATSFANLKTWSSTTYWDRYSISGIAPAFVSATDLHPDLANPNVWAIHGRGTQIKGYTSDIDGKYRPDSLTAGVPDLGAYEFFPTVLPTVLNPIPAGPPALGLTQSFLYGTDTVMKITWGANVPSSVSVRRYSGVQPPKLASGYPSADSMFFYTQVETPGDHKYDGDMKLFYLDPWQGSIPAQWMIGLGRSTEGNNWVVGLSSRVNIATKTITQSSLNFLDKFTGFLNPAAPPILPDKDTSNRGRRFWVAYPINQLNGAQDMRLYLSAQQPANVTVRIQGTTPTWERQYLVPANTVVQTELLPEGGGQNSFLNAAGLFDQGIYIESDEPIVVYAHVTGSASSGAAMVLPISTWGYEYKTLGITQQYGGGSYSFFYVIADNDNTVVQVTPTVPVQNAGMAANTLSTVTLNKGQVFLVVASSQTQELTGSTVKSVANGLGDCYPVTVFSGSSRTALSIGCGSGGDFMMQQNFPATAWGKYYLTAPSSASTSSTAYQENVFRIAVRDPSTVVKRNNVQLTGLINNHYYQYQSTTADFIESDRPIMVAQFLTGACTGVGDPEMIYISPIEQAINNVGFYRNNLQAIQTNLLTMIIPTNGLPSLVIKDGNTAVAPDAVYSHPANGNPTLQGRNYSVVVKSWPSAQQQVTVVSDSSFVGITYGLGSVESYGYNMGTLVKNINASLVIRNDSSQVQTDVDYTCVGSPFKFKTALKIKPTSMTFKLSKISDLTPNADVTLTNPAPTDSFTVGWQKFYIFELPGSYTFNTPGFKQIEITYTHPDIEGCNNTGINVVYVQVLPAPKADFTITFSGCEATTAQFAGDAAASGSPVGKWKWTFHDGSTTLGQNSSFLYNTPGTYNVKLSTITKDGCLGDSIKPVVVNPRPTAAVVTNKIDVCPGGSATFNIQGPLAGATYVWYTAATGGTPIATGGNYTLNADGTTFTVSNVTALTEYWVEAVSSIGCVSFTRVKVEADILPLLPPTVVSVTGSTANTVSVSWTAVSGAIGYQVSVNGGVFVTPSSGATGTTHTVTGLGILDSVNVVVRVVGALACQNSTSAYVTGCSNSAPNVVTNSISICTNGTATFNVQGATSNITYTWYNALTGGTAVGTGTSFTTPTLTATTNYYLEHVSAAGCLGSPRTQVTATVLSPLAVAVPVVSSSTPTTVTFTWTAIAGATAYEVSVNGGPFITPSSGATGLTHTVTGLSTLQSACIVVRTTGALACQQSTSASVCGCANSSATVTNPTVSVCTGTPATFTIQSPVFGVTYNWYSALTGGTLLGTGNSFISPSVSGTTNFYVEQVSGGGCVGTPRTQVTATILAPLPAPVVTVADADRTINAITFRWTAVAGAVGYLVSVDGATFVVPSSGSTGLSHTVSGLTPLKQVCIVVRALGTIACQNSESASVCSTTRPDQIYIPNTFTPNGDGKNDQLIAYGFAIQSIRFMVFNQWGEKIHEINNSTMDVSNGGFVIWDGKAGGKVQPIGVYVYATTIVLKDGTTIQKSGALNIVR